MKRLHFSYLCRADFGPILSSLRVLPPSSLIATRAREIPEKVEGRTFQTELSNEILIGLFSLANVKGGEEHTVEVEEAVVIRRILRHVK